MSIFAAYIFLIFLDTQLHEAKISEKKTFLNFLLVVFYFFPGGFNFFQVVFTYSVKFVTQKLGVGTIYLGLMGARFLIESVMLAFLKIH